MAQLYDQALDVLDKLLTDEDDFYRAQLLNSIMIDLIRLKHNEALTYSASLNRVN